MTTSFAYRTPGPTTAASAEAIDALAEGEPIILGNRAVLVGCAGLATPRLLAFIIRHSTGFVQVALHERTCDLLLLPEATPSVRDISVASHGQCVAVDAAHGITTGISAADRAATARVLADPASTSSDLIRPGHLVPVRVGPTELRDRSTVAAVALMLTDAAAPGLSGAVFADLEGVVNPCDLAGLGEAEAWARRYRIALVTDQPRLHACPHT